MSNAWRIFIGLVLITVVGLTVMGMSQTSASAMENVGVIDKDFIIDVYAGPQIAAFLYEEERLQGEFDNESASMNDEDKRALFAKYQAELQEFEARLGLPTLFEEMSNAIQASAEAHGVSIVFDQNAIVLGGIDLTEDVLRRLGLLED